MHDFVKLGVTLINTLRKTGVTGRELQVLTDGLPTNTVNIADLDQTYLELDKVDLTATLTLELRDIEDGGSMSAPLVYEFTVINDIPQPTSDIFKISITRPQQGC